MWKGEIDPGATRVLGFGLEGVLTTVVGDGAVRFWFWEFPITPRSQTNHTQMDVLPAHLNRDSFRDSFKGLVALEIIFDLPFGFPINKTTLSLFSFKEF